MSVQSGHLKDELLFECYLAAHSGESLDPRAAVHLTDCGECVARYDEIVEFMAATREVADAETDEVFTTERLRVQHEEILRRLEHAHHPARVISFPSREVASASRSGLRLTPRWLAGAAAAGLFIGVGVGGYVVPERLHRRAPLQAAAPVVPPMSVQQRPASSGAVLVNGTQSDMADDDQFLMELEIALARPHTRELQPYDSMTPHVRDIENRER